jgi:oxygen-independent coproporphyrinogen-3 oxidase
MSPEMVKRYSAPVPRYTSYPTAPHFSPAVGPEHYAAWLEDLPAGAPLSIYAHIPFCHSLCWYCGCSTKAVQRPEPVAAYLETVLREIESVSLRLGRGHEVDHIHWGGGSPNILTPPQIMALNDALRRGFSVSSDAEFAVEVDPRTLSEVQVATFARIGVNRVSIGVQDFDPKVQTTINREQSFSTTEQAVAWFRAHGIGAVNIDLVYGLPHQTRDSVEETIRKVLLLAPDRIAIFGYAHLPSRFRHQTLIEEASLPDVVERFAQANRLAHILTGAGYVRIGLDHFAKRDDSLARGRVHRNFQGYTSDDAGVLIGLGASAIGQLPQGYVQNATATGDYMRKIAEKGLATARGRRLTDEDRMRGLVIERLMCDLEFPTEELRTRFGAAAQPVLDEAEILVQSDQDHLIERTDSGFRVTDRGRPFVRSIAACFDSYLASDQAQHSLAV